MKQENICFPSDKVYNIKKTYSALITVHRTTCSPRITTMCSHSAAQSLPASVTHEEPGGQAPDITGTVV